MSGDRMKEWRKANPLRYAYQSLKDNAKRREKVFELTFEQFKSFCIKSEYGTKRGIRADSFHIDRRDETGGYTIGNIQALTNADNVRKFIAFKYRDRDGPHFETVTIKPMEQGDSPF